MSISTTSDDISLPAMTRAPSSAQGSDVLPTPQDDILSLNMGAGKPRVESTAYSEPPHIDDIFVRDAPYRQGLAPPRFASPRSEWRSYSTDDVGTPRSTSARSARDLISLYEQNRSSSEMRPNPYVLDARRYDALPAAPSTYPKHRLPIRESFRNLLSAFGMKKDRKDDIGGGPYVPIQSRDVVAQASAPEGQAQLEVPFEPDSDPRIRSSETVETFSVRLSAPRTL